MNRYIKGTLLSLGCVTVLGFCGGCQKTPEDSIVKEKDFDAMIEEAKKTESTEKTSTLETEEATTVDDTNYNSYQTEFEDAKLKVKVKVDAKVDIPQVDKMSIVRVKQKEINTEMIEKLISVVAPEEEWYNAALVELERKDMIQIKIDIVKREYEQIKQEVANGERSKVEEEQARKSYEESMEIYNKMLQSAWDEIPWEPEWQLEPKMYSVNEMVNREPKNDFYNNHVNCHKDADIFYAVNRGDKGLYQTIYAQDCNKYSSCLRYHTSDKGYRSCRSIMVEDDAGYFQGIYKDGRTPIGYESEDTEGTFYVTYEKDEDSSVTISQEEAVQKAEEFLDTLGYEEYGLYEAELCNVAAEFAYIPKENRCERGVAEYRSLYVLRYLRTLDGIFINNLAGDQFGQEWNGQYYSKKIRVGEEIVLFVDDTGVVGMNYNAPLEVEDVMVDDANIKSFDEIRGIFEEMVLVANAQEELETTIEIDRVTLNYTRINEKDNFETGVIVPVWEFRGKKSVQDLAFGYQEFDDQCLLTINAIDGTVINRSLGY